MQVGGSHTFGLHRHHRVFRAASDPLPQLHARVQTFGASAAMLATVAPHAAPLASCTTGRRLPRCTAVRVHAKIKEQQYVSPSSRTSSTELERLEALSSVRNARLPLSANAVAVGWSETIASARRWCPMCC